MSSRSNTSSPSLRLLGIGIGLCVGGVVMGAGVAGALPGGDILQYGAVALALVPAFFVARKEWLLLGVLFIVYAIDGLWTAGIVPRQASWLVELLVLSLLFRVCFERLQSSLPGRAPVALTVVGVAILFSLFAGFLGHQDTLVSLLGVRKYAVYPVLGFCIMLGDWSPGLDKLVWKAMLVVALAQIPTSIYQLVTVGGGDAAGGTLGLNGTGLVAIFLTSVALTILAAGLWKDERSPWYTRAGVILLLMVPPAIGSALFAAPLLIGGAALLALTQPRGIARIGPAIALALAALVLATPTLSAYLSSIGYPDPVRLFSDPLLALNYGGVSTSSLRPGRLDQIVLAWQTATQSGPLGLLLGNGLSSASPSFFGRMATGPLLAENPYLQFVTSSVARGLIETGMFGVAAWVAVCLDCMRRGLTLRGSADGERRGTGAMSMAVGFVLLASGLYNDAWHEPATAALLWVVYALAVRSEYAEPVADVVERTGVVLGQHLGR